MNFKQGQIVRHTLAKGVTLALLLCSLVGEVWALAPPPAYWAGPRFSVPPPGFVPIRYGAGAFYFSYGRFYRRGPAGYALVPPPLGFVVPALPIGFATFVVNDITYYDLNGVYYTRVPNGYQVVESPLVEEKKVVTPSVESIHRVVVKAELLNVRKGPGKDQEVLRQVERGRELKVIGNIPEWYYVELDTGERGWVLMKFVSPAGPVPEG